MKERGKGKGGNSCGGPKKERGGGKGNEQKGKKKPSAQQCDQKRTERSGLSGKKKEVPRPRQRGEEKPGRRRSRRGKDTLQKVSPSTTKNARYPSTKKRKARKKARGGKKEGTYRARRTVTPLCYRTRGGKETSPNDAREGEGEEQQRGRFS